MEKETYKTAVELLQRYEPTHPSLQNSTPRQPTEHSQPSSSHGRKSELRRRVPPVTPAHPSLMHQDTPPQPHRTPRLTPSLSPTFIPSPASTEGGAHHSPPSTPTRPAGNMGVPAAGNMGVAAAGSVGVAATVAEDSKQPFIPPGTKAPHLARYNNK